MVNTIRYVTIILVDSMEDLSCMELRKKNKKTQTYIAESV